MAKIEYFYSAHSAFAYLGSLLFSKISKGQRVQHHPIDLSKTVPAAGISAFSERTPAHKKYFFGREIQRWAQWRNVQVMRGHPVHHNKDIAMANCMLIAAAEQGLDVQPLAHAMMQSHWRDNSDLSDTGTLERLGLEVGFDSKSLLEQAVTPGIRNIYGANTSEAIDRSVFGSPTYFVDGDMFYGQDRLELVERALEQPFDGQWPK